jgi:hypothetical protein
LQLQLVPTIELTGRRSAAQKTVDGEYDIFVLAANPMHPDYGLSKDEIMRGKSRQLVVDTWEGVLRAEEDVARRMEERNRL